MTVFRCECAGITIGQGKKVTKMKLGSAYYFWQALAVGCQVLTVGCFVAACAAPYDGGNRFEVKMTVVYADRDTINAEARYRGYRSQANGFFDPLRNELWCPDEESKEAFRTCGHELRHVVKGDFHGTGTLVLANRTISSGRYQSSEDRVGRPGQSTAPDPGQSSKDTAGGRR